MSTHKVRPTLEERLAKINRRAWVPLVIVIFLLALQIKWWWIPGEDAVSYLSIARNFAHGQIERFGSPHLRYALGFPLVIAPAFLLSDRPFLCIALIQFLMAVLLLLGIHKWMRSLFPESGAAPLLLTCLVMLNAGFWHNYQESLSEITFLAQLVWATYALHRVMSERSIGRVIGWGFLAFLMIAFASITRHVGVFLVAGFGTAMLLSVWRKEVTLSRAVVTTLLIGLPVAVVTGSLILWDQGRASLVEGAQGYLESMVDDTTSFQAQLLESFRLRMGEIGRLLIPGMLRAYARAGEWLHINTVLYGLTSMVVGIGWWRLARKSADPFLFMFPFYVVFLITWPFDQGTRFLLPMLPVLAASLWMLLEPWTRHRLSILFILCVLHGVIAMGDWMRTLGAIRLHDQWSEIETIADAIKTPSEGVAILHLDKALGLMLALELNTHVDIPSNGVVLHDAPEWVLVAAHDDVVDGYISVLSTPNLELRHRVESERGDDVPPDAIPILPVDE